MSLQYHVWISLQFYCVPGDAALHCGEPGSDRSALVAAVRCRFRKRDIICSSGFASWPVEALMCTNLQISGCSSWPVEASCLDIQFVAVLVPFQLLQAPPASLQSSLPSWWPQPECSSWGRRRGPTHVTHDMVTLCTKTWQHVHSMLLRRSRVFPSDQCNRSSTSCRGIRSSPPCGGP